MVLFNHDYYIIITNTTDYIVIIWTIFVSCQSEIPSKIARSSKDRTIVSNSLSKTLFSESGIGCKDNSMNPQCWEDIWKAIHHISPVAVDKTLWYKLSSIWKLTNCEKVNTLCVKFVCLFSFYFQSNKNKLFYVHSAVIKARQVLFFIIIEWNKAHDSTEIETI